MIDQHWVDEIPEGAFNGIDLRFAVPLDGKITDVLPDQHFPAEEYEFMRNPGLAAPYTTYKFMVQTPSGKFVYIPVGQHQIAITNHQEGDHKYHLGYAVGQIIGGAYLIGRLAARKRKMECSP